MRSKFYAGYEVFNDGTILNSRGKKLKHTVRPDGYHTVNMNGLTKRVHRVVAECFIGNPEGKRTVNHKDGDKSNNGVSNLEWATHSENTQHAYDNDLNWAHKGTENPNSKLSPAEVEYIRCSAKERYYGWAKEMCLQFNISRTNLYKCINGESYEEAD